MAINETHIQAVKNICILVDYQDQATNINAGLEFTLQDTKDNIPQDTDEGRGTASFRGYKGPNKSSRRTYTQTIIYLVGIINQEKGKILKAFAAENLELSLGPGGIIRGKNLEKVLLTKPNSRSDLRPVLERIKTIGLSPRVEQALHDLLIIKDFLSLQRTLRKRTSDRINDVYKPYLGNGDLAGAVQKAWQQIKELFPEKEDRKVFYDSLDIKSLEPAAIRKNELNQPGDDADLSAEFCRLEAHLRQEFGECAEITIIGEFPLFAASIKREAGNTIGKLARVLEVEIDEIKYLLQAKENEGEEEVIIELNEDKELLSATLEETTIYEKANNRWTIPDDSKVAFFEEELAYFVVSEDVDQIISGKEYHDIPEGSKHVLKDSKTLHYIVLGDDYRIKSGGLFYTFKKGSSLYFHANGFIAKGTQVDGEKVEFDEKGNLVGDIIKGADGFWYKNDKHLVWHKKEELIVNIGRLALATPIDIGGQELKVPRLSTLYKSRDTQIEKIVLSKATTVQIGKYAQTLPEGSELLIKNGKIYAVKLGFEDTYIQINDKTRLLCTKKSTIKFFTAAGIYGQVKQAEIKQTDFYVANDNQLSLTPPEDETEHIILSTPDDTTVTLKRNQTLGEVSAPEDEKITATIKNKRFLFTHFVFESDYKYGILAEDTEKTVHLGVGGEDLLFAKATKYVFNQDNSFKSGIIARDYNIPSTPHILQKDAFIETFSDGRFSYKIVRPSEREIGNNRVTLQARDIVFVGNNLNYDQLKFAGQATVMSKLSIEGAKRLYRLMDKAFPRLDSTEDSYGDKKKETFIVVEIVLAPNGTVSFDRYERIESFTDARDIYKIKKNVNMLGTPMATKETIPSKRQLTLQEEGRKEIYIIFEDGREHETGSDQYKAILAKEKTVTLVDEGVKLAPKTGLTWIKKNKQWVIKNITPASNRQELPTGQYMAIYKSGEPTELFTEAPDKGFVKSGILEDFNVFYLYPNGSYSVGQPRETKLSATRTIIFRPKNGVEIYFDTPDRLDRLKTNILTNSQIIIEIGKNKNKNTLYLSSLDHDTNNNAYVGEIATGTTFTVGRHRLAIPQKSFIELAEKYTEFTLAKEVEEDMEINGIKQDILYEGTILRVYSENELIELFVPEKTSFKITEDIRITIAANSWLKLLADGTYHIKQANGQIIHLDKQGKEIDDDEDEMVPLVDPHKITK